MSKEIVLDTKSPHEALDLLYATSDGVAMQGVARVRKNALLDQPISAATMETWRQWDRVDKEATLYVDDLDPFTY